jgi:hypothetical protein
MGIPFSAAQRASTRRLQQKAEERFDFQFIESLGAKRR